MHIGGYESSRFGKHLTGLDYVTHGHYRLGRSAKMLCHGNIHGLRQRQNFYFATPGYLVVIRMNTSD